MDVASTDFRGGLTIIIPCYNEAENIPVLFPAILDFCLAHDYQLIVVDDGSTDATAEALAKFRAPCLQVFRHSLNRGYGAAIKTGIRKASSPYCVTVDADGQHCLEDIAGLLNVAAKERADLVVGNRRGMGSSRFRNLGKWIIVGFAGIFFQLPVRDLNSGMKLYRTRIAQSLVRWTPDGMAYSDVVTLIHWQLRYKVVEHPVRILPRQRGTSTISWRTGLQTISEIAFLAVNVIPFRFFSRLALLFFLAGFGWGLPFAWQGKGITVGSALLMLTALVIFLQGIMMELLVRMKYQNYDYPD